MIKIKKKLLRNKVYWYIKPSFYAKKTHIRFWLYNNVI